jgi:hypothetical protein
MSSHPLCGGGTKPLPDSRARPRRRAFAVEATRHRRSVCGSTVLWSEVVDRRRTVEPGPLAVQHDSVDHPAEPGATLVRESSFVESIFDLSGQSGQNARYGGKSNCQKGAVERTRRGARPSRPPPWPPSSAALGFIPDVKSWSNLFANLTLGGDGSTKNDHACSLRSASKVSSFRRRYVFIPLQREH